MDDRVDRCGELCDIAIIVFQWPVSDTALHPGLCNRARDNRKQGAGQTALESDIPRRIAGFHPHIRAAASADDVLRASSAMPSTQAIFMASIDIGRANIQRTAKNERKAQNVVDLIGVIRPAGCKRLRRGQPSCPRQA